MRFLFGEGRNGPLQPVVSHDLDPRLTGVEPDLSMRLDREASCRLCRWFDSPDPKCSICSGSGRVPAPPPVYRDPPPVVSQIAEDACR